MRIDYNWFNTSSLQDISVIFGTAAVIHAAGGAGDIVINYDNLILMIEVTLMNKQAQKRGIDYNWFNTSSLQDISVIFGTAAKEVITASIILTLDVSSIRNLGSRVR